MTPPGPAKISSRDEQPRGLEPSRLVVDELGRRLRGRTDWALDRGTNASPGGGCCGALPELIIELL